LIRLGESISEDLSAEAAVKFVYLLTGCSSSASGDLSDSCLLFSLNCRIIFTVAKDLSFLTVVFCFSKSCLLYFNFSCSFRSLIVMKGKSWCSTKEWALRN